jgi:hypothetical protein
MTRVINKGDIMKSLLQITLACLLSSQLLADDTLSLNFDKFKSDKNFFPMLSLSIKPKELQRFELIFSYVSNAFELKKSQLAKQVKDYKYTQIAFNLRF